MTTPKITSQDGSAAYVFAHDEPAAFLVDAIPGARAAHDAWTAANEEGRRLRDEREAAGLRLRDLRRADALTAEIEPAEVTLREAGQAVATATGRALTALRRFDGIVRDARRGDDSTHRLAASTALSAHARATAARDALIAALDERDQAWSLAGSPGASWERRTGRDRHGDWRRARAVLDARVDHFAADATAAVANGQAQEHEGDEVRGASAEQAASASAAASHADAYSAQRATR